MNDIDKKVVLTTGCSSGFGMLTAARLSAKGYHVVATMRNLNKQGALVDEVKRRGGEITLFQLNVVDYDSIQNCMQKVAEKFGVLDVLVNNAGFGIFGFFEDLKEEEIRKQMETNFFGVQNVIKAALPLMRHAPNAKIINISSASGFSGSPCMGAYNASKWALEGFSESLRHELKFFDIDVLLIEPGTYKTKIFYENAKVADRFNDETSPYYPMSMFLQRRVRDRVDDCHKDPEEVAELVEKLIKSKNPPFRNIPDVESKLHAVLRRVLPYRLYDYLTRKIIFKGFDPDK